MKWLKPLVVGWLRCVINASNKKGQQMGKIRMKLKYAESSDFDAE